MEARILQVYKTRGALGTIAEINMLILCFQLSIKIFKSTTQHVVIELRTFLSYAKSDILGLGYKTEQVNGRVYVNFCWCKVCAKNKDGIIQNTTLRGNTQSSALAFINETNVADKVSSKYRFNNDIIHCIKSDDDD